MRMQASLITIHVQNPKNAKTALRLLTASNGGPWANSLQ